MKKYRQKLRYKNYHKTYQKKYSKTSKWKDYIKEFKLNYSKENNSLEIIIPKMLHFQNLAMMKFGLAMDLQTHMDIGDVTYIEVFEKIQLPTPAESVAQKV